MITTTTNNHMAVAKTILDQLGGKTFIIVTGAKKLVATSDKCGGLRFDMPAADPKPKNGIRRILIELNANDLYDVTFFTRKRVYDEKWCITTTDYPVVSEHKDIYAESLIDLFQEKTGYIARVKLFFGRH